MIFVTVGTQLPFPRLVDAVNRIAGTTGEATVAQTNERSDAWNHLDVHPSLAPDAFSQFFGNARVVVAHAGIGTVLSARKLKKPLILVPRRADLGEHRNDHQMATARQLETTHGVRVCWDIERLGEMIQTPPEPPGEEVRSPSKDALVGRISDFIRTGA